MIANLCDCGGGHAVSQESPTGHAVNCPTRLPIADALVVQAIVGLPMRLKAHRAARGHSMREVAKRTGMSFSTICRVENGEDYAVSNLIALAAYLDGDRG